MHILRGTSNLVTRAMSTAWTIGSLAKLERRTFEMGQKSINRSLFDMSSKFRSPFLVKSQQSGTNFYLENVQSNVCILRGVGTVKIPENENSKAKHVSPHRIDNYGDRFFVYDFIDENFDESQWKSLKQQVCTVLTQNTSRDAIMLRLGGQMHGSNVIKMIVLKPDGTAIDYSENSSRVAEGYLRENYGKNYYLPWHLLHSERDSYGSDYVSE